MEWPLILLIVFIVLVSMLLGVAATLMILEYTRFPRADVTPDLLKTGQPHLTTVLPPSPPPLPPPLVHPDMPSEQEQVEHGVVTMPSISVTVPILEESACDRGRASQEPRCESAASGNETTPLNLYTLHDTALTDRGIPYAEVGIQIPQRCSWCKQTAGQTLPLQLAPRQAQHESQDVARCQGHWPLPWSEWSTGSFGGTQRWPVLPNIGNRNLSAGTMEVLSVPGQLLPLEHRRHVPGPGQYACSSVPRETTWPMEPMACTDG